MKQATAIPIVYNLSRRIRTSPVDWYSLYNNNRWYSRTPNSSLISNAIASAVSNDSILSNSRSQRRKRLLLYSVYDDYIPQQQLPKGNVQQQQQQQHWSNWYLPQEYENPWDMIHTTDHIDSRFFNNNNLNSKDTISLQSFAKQLDYSSKHCISLLQNYHYFTQNSITTEYCNTILHKLYDILPNSTSSATTANAASTLLSNNNNNNNNNNSSNVHSNSKSLQIAHRAYMILQNMEFIDHHILPNINQYPTKSNMIYNPAFMIRTKQIRNQLLSSDDSSGSSIIESNATSTVQRRSPRTLPKPNRDTYNIMLLLLSRTSGSYNIPCIAHCIVQQMEYRYNTYQELDMKVTNYHWNCVLLSWSLCIEQNDKCIYATQLLISNAIRNTNHEIVDASSYIHVLRICANHVKQQQASSSSSSQPQQYSLLGANVAIELWKLMFERGDITNNKEAQYVDLHQYTSLTYDSERNPVPEPSLLTQHLNEDDRRKPLYVPEIPPHFYSHFLQAIRPLPVTTSSTSSRYQRKPTNDGNTTTAASSDYSLRDLYYMKCMDHAIANGKVNQYVLQEFFVHVKNRTIFDKYLGEYRQQIYGMTPNDAVQYLINNCIPQHWSNKVISSTYNYSNNANNTNASSSS